MIIHDISFYDDILTFKAPITTAADNIHIYIYIFYCFSETIRLDFQVNNLLGRGLT